MTHSKYRVILNKIEKLTEDIKYEIKTAEKVNRVITLVEIKLPSTTEISCPLSGQPINRIKSGLI
jgi:hypothetical protein